MFGHNKGAGGAGVGIGMDVGLPRTDNMSNDVSFEC